MKIQILTILTVLTAAAVAPAVGGELTVTITDVRSSKGSILVSLTNSEAAWDSKAPPVAEQKLAAQTAVEANGQLTVRFADVPAGSYAVLVMHDENDDGKLDMNVMGIPTEGYGFSNNPVVMRKAYFSESKFEVGAEASAIVIHLR